MGTKENGEASKTKVQYIHIKITMNTQYFRELMIKTG